MPQRGIVVDQFTPLSHIDIVGEPGRPTRAGLNLAPTWVPATEQRRLAAYLARAALLENGARQLMPADVDDTTRADHREYGDPAVIIDRIVAAVLGDTWTVTVDGANDTLTDGPDLPDAPDALPTDADPIATRIHAALTAAYTRDVDSIVTAWEQALDEQPAARARQTDLRAWADRVMLAATISEGEHDAVGLGDGVYVLWPGAPGDWPTVQVYEPGFYFPELPDDGDRGEYPPAVHMAWEFETERDGKVERFVRRLTWQLVDLTVEAMVQVARGGVAWAGPDGLPLPEGETPALPVGDTLGADGIIRRVLPWHGEGDDPTETTCVYSDGTWPLADVGADVYALDPSKAKWRAQRLDLGIDYIPVVHDPNTAEGKTHYGRSILDRVAQLLDDIAANDTAIASGSAYLGDPVIAVSGDKNVDGAQVIPGRMYGTGAGGRMDVLDLSAGLQELQKIGDRLADRLLRNVGIPGEVVGRFDGNDLAGITLLLKYEPFAQLIAALRMPREPKYRLLLKFVQRLAQVAGALDAGPTPVARLQFGNFLPTDRNATVELVTKAVAGHVMSRQTALTLMIAAGIPVDDAQAELDRIRAEDFEGAVQIAEATANETAAGEYLQLELPGTGTGTPPVVDLP